MKNSLFAFLFMTTLQCFAQNIETIKIDSKVFGVDREIMIYTPRLYDKSPDKKYEVVYVFDSQARQYFDIVHSDLTFLNNAVPMIVVGVASPERDEDFLPPYKHEETARMMRGKQGKASRFLDYLNTEVFPYVEQNYRTLPTRIAVGHSNGGVFISYCLLEKPELFDAYISISPHLRYDQMQMIDRFNQFDSSTLKKSIFYYMCKGNEASTGWEESITKARTFFENDALQQKIHFEYELFPKLDHTTVIPTAIINGFNAWFNYQYWNLDNLKAYNNRLKKESNYELSEQDMVGLIYNRYWAKDRKNAMSILNWALEKYPDSKMLGSVQKRIGSLSMDSEKKEGTFPERALGVWEGTMHMYRYDKLRDSVRVRFTAAETNVDSIYTWKTEYLSPTRPAVKDYKLIVDDASKGRYLLDEGADVKLIDTHIGNKLMSVFKVDGILLISSYEFINGNLVFEVSSGRSENEISMETKNPANGKVVISKLNNFAFSNLQRVVLHQVK